MSVKTYSGTSDIELSPHFNSTEFKCKCGKDHDFQIDSTLVDNLEKLFEALDCSKIIISSGFRCKEHDISVGGTGTGQHTLGKAADFCCYDSGGNPIASYKVCCAAQDIGFTGIARINGSYTHCDVRSNGKWYGDETQGNGTVTSDFYECYKVDRKERDSVDGAKKGIDVSAHQGKIEWGKVKADFAILRAGFGKELSQKDEQFEANYSGAKAAGIPVGAYWYSYAVSTDEAAKEAECFLAVLKGKQFEYPVFFDVEESNQFALGKEKVSAIIKTFLNKVESAGYWAGLYMTASPLQTYVTEDIRKRYAVWVANVGVSKPAYDGVYGLWQYSWDGSVTGISGKVDMDYCYVDYPAKIKSLGLNGYTKPIEKQPESDSLPIVIEIGGVKYKGTVTKI